MKKSTITFIYNTTHSIAYRYNKCSDADQKQVYKKDLLDFCSYFSSVYGVSISVHQPVFIVCRLSFTLSLRFAGFMYGTA